MVSDIRIDQVFGYSSTSASLKSGNAISCSDNGLLAYAAGCVLVLRDLKSSSPANAQYLSLPRSTTAPTIDHPSTPTQTNRKDTTNVLSFDDFAEPSKGKDKTKPIVSVGISPDAKWAACGEQGQSPSIFLWDLRCGDVHIGPNHIIKVHSYGVRHLAFSPASHFLASVGYLHDGTIHVWDLRRGVRKIATNRVTANVHSVIWVGNKLLTIGTRHVRIWQWKIEPITKSRRSSLEAHKESAAVLEGRNLVLGSHVHSEFVSACALDTRRALVVTSQAVCFVDVDEKHPLIELFKVEYNISSIARRGAIVLIGDTTGNVHSYVFEECGSLCIQDRNSPMSLPNLDHQASSNHQASHITAIYQYESRLFTASSTGGLAMCYEHSSQTHTLSNSLATLAIHQNKDDLSCLFALENGKVLKRAGDKLFTPWPHRLSNSAIHAVKFLTGGKIICGDSDGKVHYTSIIDGGVHSDIRAHDGDVMGLDIDSTETQLLTFGRDKMLQLLLLSPASSGLHDLLKLQVQQTFDDHTACITGALFLGSDHILSSSVDRTLVLRTRHANGNFVVHRIYDLKATPTAIATDAKNPVRVLVSCLDRSFWQLDIESGEIKELCKTEDSYDLLTINGDSEACCCISSADKSICLRSAETGAVLSNKGYGHIDKITSAQWSTETENLVITTSLDGLVFYWWFQPPESIPSPSTPIRKIMPKTESLRLGLQRTSGSIRRSSSVPRLNQTSNRALSPSKLGIAGRSPSPKRPTSGNSLTGRDVHHKSDSPGSPDVLKSIVHETITNLAQIKASMDALTDNQREALRNASVYLFDGVEVKP